MGVIYHFEVLRGVPPLETMKELYVRSEKLCGCCVKFGWSLRNELSAADRTAQTFQKKGTTYHFDCGWFDADT